MRIIRRTGTRSLGDCRVYGELALGLYGLYTMLRTGTWFVLDGRAYVGQVLGI